MKGTRAPEDGFIYLTDEMQDVFKQNTVGNSKIVPMCYRVYNSEDSGGGSSVRPRTHVGHFKTSICGADFCNLFALHQKLPLNLYRHGNERSPHSRPFASCRRKMLSGTEWTAARFAPKTTALNLTFIQHVAAALTSRLNVCQPGRRL